MAPLLPSEAAAYSLAMPEEADDDRLNLKLRTGAASAYTHSTVVVHGGSTLGLGLPTITVPEIEAAATEALGVNKDWNNYLSSELFYLNIINRKWNRFNVEPDAARPRARMFHSITLADNALYVFGGLVLQPNRNKLTPVCDLWRFSLDNNTWECLDEGTITATIARYDHTTKPVDYISPVDLKSHQGLAIVGGRGEMHQELMNIAIWDLKEKRYLSNAEIQLTQNELKHEEIVVDGRKTSAKGARSKFKVTSPSSFVIAGTSIPGGDALTEAKDTLFIFSQDGISENNLKNPLIALPVTPNASGLRLSLAESTLRNTSVVPRGLKNPTGGIFGSNIIVSGQSMELGEYQVYLFNIPSQKWTRLSIDTKLKAKDMYLWKSFSWQSHHKAIVLGSPVFPKGSEYATIQKFDMLVLVGLPITNIFHGSSAPVAGSTAETPATRGSIKDTLSFEAYSKYLAPSSKISSIRSVFPSYAVTLGRNAFERYGGSLADFEFVTADGDKVNVPLMLLRKRWGRCFDMLLAKAYARAVYKLDNAKEEEDEEDDIRSSVSSNHQSKKSMKMMSKASQQGERPNSEAPQFRLPFQDKTSGMSPLTSISSGGHLTPSLPTSRKASVVSTSGLSVNTTSTNDPPDGPDFSNLPPASAPPTEPLPPVEQKPAFLKSVGSRDYLRESPRGSVSGASTNSAPLSVPTTVPSGIKLKDLRTPVNQLKKRGTSKSSGPSQGGASTHDDTSLNETGSGLQSLHTDAYEENKNLLEPLLIPRSLYLPFSTQTVQAISEFLFVGKLGDKWLLYPTTTDTFLVSKFYELPLLYDLISEALYAILGKKEDGLMKKFGTLMKNYHIKVKEIFGGDEFMSEKFFEERPHIKETFTEIEGYLNTVDDGFMNLAFFKRLGKNSAMSSNSTTTKGSVDIQRGSASGSKARIGKSSLSREVKAEAPDGAKKDEPLDDIDNEAEEDDDQVTDKPLEPIARAASKEPIKFRTDSMSNPQMSPRKVLSDDDDLDPITPLTRVVDAMAIEDDGDPLTENPTESDGVGPLDNNGSVSDSKNTDSESEPSFAVPEGNFKMSKGDKLVKLKSGGSSSSQKDEKTTTTSDSDEMAVGLGLVTSLKQKKKSKGAINRYAEDDKDDSDEDSILQTLELLASPNSPAPRDNVIQVIYEAAALACDMKLLLRSMNVLEMSKILNNKADELLKELDDYGLRYEEDKLKKQQEETERVEQEQLEQEQIVRAREEQESLAREAEAQEQLTREKELRERGLQEMREDQDFEDIQAQLVKGKVRLPTQSSATSVASELVPSSSAVFQKKVSPSKSSGATSVHSSNAEGNAISPQKSLRASMSSMNMRYSPQQTRAGSVHTSSSGGSDSASITSVSKRGFLRPFSRKPSGAVGTYNDQVSGSRVPAPAPVPTPSPAPLKDEKKTKLFGLLSRKSTAKK